MKKDEFLKQLRNKLKKLPPEEVENAVEYYEEYLNDVGEENEESTIASWGSPSCVASQIMAQYAVKQMTVEPSAKKGLAAVWIVLLAVFASPIALPVAAALTAVVLAMIVVVISVILALGAAAVSVALAGVTVFIMGLCVLVRHIPTAIFFLGTGLFCAGAGVALFLFVIWISKKSFNGIAKLISKLLPGRKAV